MVEEASPPGWLPMKGQGLRGDGESGRRWVARSRRFITARWREICLTGVGPATTLLTQIGGLAAITGRGAHRAVLKPSNAA
jgi:hypothetical protein